MARGRSARNGWSFKLSIVRIFQLPSWCPTADSPHGGTFFVEQAHAMARLRPDWTVAICQFDLGSSRVPWRAWQLPRFAHNWLINPRLSHAVAASGLHVYTLWAPHLPRWGVHYRWQAMVRALAAQARPALTHFMMNHGRPDLIHALASYPGGGAAAILGRNLQIPVGITEHLGPFPPSTLCWPNGQPLPVLVQAYAGAARVGAVSQSLADQIVRLGLAGHVDVLPNFLADDFGSAVARAEMRRPAFSFLNVGDPSQEKGTDVLLKALVRCKPAIRLQVVGAGTQMARFQRMALDLGVSDRVAWLGALCRQDMLAAYAAADAVVLASQGETFGMVLIEALACGKPLVATRCGGPLDIVHPGNGLLVPVDDVPAMAAAMNQMGRSSEQYAAPALRADFQRRFSASAMVGKMEHWYGLVTAREPAGSGI